jgi:hypothetical protein
MDLTNTKIWPTWALPRKYEYNLTQENDDSDHLAFGSLSK